MQRCAFLLPWLLPLAMQAQVRINEVQCTRVPRSNGQGTAGDWVELYNADRKAAALGGHVLVLNGRSQVLPQDLAIGPRDRLVLWCDRAPEAGPDHLDMNLPRTGATLLLVAPDRSTVLDIFHWPALPGGTSFGRQPDGARASVHFGLPTPGQPNGNGVPGVTVAPLVQESEGMVVLSVPGNAEVRYTMDGTAPGPGSLRYTTPLSVPSGTVVRARSFSLQAVAGAEVVHTTGVSAGSWALAMDPADLTGPAGINDTLRGNHARKGRAWQRQAWLQQPGRSAPVGIAIAGSGSRSLPKRSFKLLARDRFASTGPMWLPDSTAWKDLMLRADATPHAFLRNLFIHETAIRSGAHVDVQPSFPVDLLLNGEFQGLYRAMPAKGREWLGSLAGGGPVEIIEGPAARPVSGSNKGYLRLVDALATGRPPDQLAAMADVESLLDLACFDLWTGRADHELNLRAWKPGGQSGRWRWVLYDMDLWAPPDDRSVPRMCTQVPPQAPYLPQIMANAPLRDLFLARFTALCATTLAPAQAIPLADSLFAQYRGRMLADQERWKAEMPVPTPEQAHADLVRHITLRGDELFGQLAAFTGEPLRRLTISVEPEGPGHVAVEGLRLSSSHQDLRVFGSVPLHLEAMAREGMEFAGWQGLPGQDGDQVAVVPGRATRITAVFRPVGWSGKGGL